MVLNQLRNRFRTYLYTYTEGQKFGPEGLPLPAAHLRFLVAGTDDIDWFVESGRLGAHSITETLQKNGLSLKQFTTMLDFGCGCGRVIRYWHELPNTLVYGCDYNKKLINWCQKYLPFAQCAVNNLEPPLPYANHSFDFVYALSIFTHMPEDLQHTWMAEMARVLKPEGYLLITTHGEFYLDHLTEREKAQYQAGQLIVHQSQKAGANDCAAFHPATYIQDEMAKDFKLIDFIPEGALGNPRQDITLLQKLNHGA